MESWVLPLSRQGSPQRWYAKSGRQGWWDGCSGTVSQTREALPDSPVLSTLSSWDGIHVPPPLPTPVPQMPHASPQPALFPTKHNLWLHPAQALDPWPGYSCPHSWCSHLTTKLSAPHVLWFGTVQRFPHPPPEPSGDSRVPQADVFI